MDSAILRESRLAGFLRYARGRARHALKRTKWEILYRTRKSFVYRLTDDVCIKLYFDSELSRLIFLREFEVTERYIMRQVLNPGDVFVDIGANIGLFSLLAATRVGKNGRVISFEPVSEIHRRLIENIELNEFSQIAPIRVAVTDRSGFVDIHVGGNGYDAWSSVAPPYMGSVDRIEQSESSTWDEFSARWDLTGKVAMMKLDVEGCEERVLVGASSCLKRDDAPILQVEFTEAAAKATGSNCRVLHEMLLDYGYKIFVPGQESLLVPLPLSDRYRQANIFALKNHQGVARRLGVELASGC